MMQSVRHDRAVSPVVGVMLMLVVTIIIAAVVSAFAGGLGQTSSKVPQTGISAEARDNKEIIVDFTGGDQVNGGAIILKTYIPMGSFKDMSHQINLKNVTYLPTNEKVKTDWSAKTLQSGDKIRIDWSDAFSPSSLGGYVAPAVGEPLSIEIYDSASGKVIATTQTSILP